MVQSKITQSKKNIDKHPVDNEISLKKDYSTQEEKILEILTKKYNIGKDEAKKILQKIEDNEKNKDVNKQKINMDEMKTLNNEQNLEQNPIDVNNNHEKQSPDDVDSILSEILPDYKQHVSIELNHVDLTFETEIDKLDTLKEKVIRTLNRDKNKKMKVHALKDVTFKVYKGEKVGIIGYNGAGKSTLLNVITGIYPPDKGFVKTNGKISPLLSLGAGFDFNYSGRKNIYLNGAVLGYDKQFLESKIDEIIEFSELEEFIDLPIKNYSSGMLAKLGFSIATIVEPDILIIDEILGVGDVNFQKKSSDKIRSMIDSGTTVLIVSHSIQQIRDLCQKVIWIDQGQVKEIGATASVCDHYLKDAEKASTEQIKNIKLR